MDFGPNLASKTLPPQLSLTISSVDPRLDSVCNWKDKQDALQASLLVFFGPSQVFRGESSPWHLAACHLVYALFSLLAKTNSLAISSFQLLISKAMKALSLLSNLVPYVML